MSRNTAARGSAPRARAVSTITEASLSHEKDIRNRATAYIISMSIRMACFFLAVLTPSPWRWIFAAGAIVLPWVSVLIANAAKARLAPDDTSVIDSAPLTGLGPGSGDRTGRAGSGRAEAGHAGASRAGSGRTESGQTDSGRDAGTGTGSRSGTGADTDAGRGAGAGRAPTAAASTAGASTSDDDGRLEHRGSADYGMRRGPRRPDPTATVPPVDDTAPTMPDDDSAAPDDEPSSQYANASTIDGELDLDRISTRKAR